jgi:hypothetical protein
MKHNIQSWPLRQETEKPVQQQTPSPYPAVIIGRFTGIAPDGTPLVVWQGADGAESRPALTLTPIGPQEIGCRCTLVFEEGDPQKPVILGLLHDNRSTPRGYRILQGDQALILQCGTARIELHQEGRVIIQGLEIDNQAYGPYRIKGASVKVN